MLEVPLSRSFAGLEKRKADPIAMIPFHSIMSMIRLWSLEKIFQLDGDFSFLNILDCICDFMGSKLHKRVPPVECCIQHPIGSSTLVIPYGLKSYNTRFL